MQIRHLLLCVASTLFGSVAVALGQPNEAKPTRYEYRKDHDPDGLG